MRTFFEKAGSPVAHLAEDFLHAADQYRLDWRLLPSISMVESGAGKRFINNNIFGWDSGKRAFESVRDGLYHVASRLSGSKLYRDKPLDELLATYNRNADWASLVKSLMLRVDPDEPLKARAYVSLPVALRSTGRQAPAP